MRLLLIQQLPHKLSILKKQLIQQKKFLQQRQVFYSKEKEQHQQQQQKQKQHNISKFINLNKYILTSSPTSSSSSSSSNFSNFSNGVIHSSSSSSDNTNLTVTNLTSTLHTNEIICKNSNDNNNEKMNKSLQAALLITVRMSSLINIELKKLYQKKKNNRKNYKINKITFAGTKEKSLFSLSTSEFSSINEYPKPTANNLINNSGSDNYQLYIKNNFNKRETLHSKDFI